ncbi:hypothetical protein LTR09_010387 [Extremus antarcticus]|uniref:ICE2-like protein n=1 Tax=Extremus antarcticus TaxID=702011 RepID=A0AAJ0DDN5_9PEZI|nr:hypothetical protein LTR09_010387 [Extremus antarcticus]
MILRVLSSTAFLLSIVFTVPLAFDVGGRTCGLAFSLSLATYYFILSCLRLATPDNSRWRRALANTYAGLQIIIIPGFLIWCLNKFSIETGDDASWVSRAFYNTTKPLHHNPSVKEWIFGREGLLEHFLIGGWDKLLRYSTPVFQLAEGFCSLLVIQACGQVTRYLVNNGDRGDHWMIGLLMFSSGVISSAVYFLYRISTFSGIDSQDAILIGMAICCAIFLCAWGMGSGRGNVVESSLLFAYITLCIYQIFTDYQPSNPASAAAQPPVEGADFPPLPPILMASYSTFVQALSSLPATLHSAFGFMYAAIRTITPSVIISLVYRLTVLYASARIIPAVRESGARALSSDPSLEESEEEIGTLMGLISYFSPSILIAVYTSLLMQHFASASSDHPGEWWTSQGGEGGGNISRWINLAGTMGLYAVELYLGKGYGDDLGGHWKMD